MNGICLDSNGETGLVTGDIVFPRIFLSVDNDGLGKLPKYTSISNEHFVMMKDGVKKISSTPNKEFLIPTTENLTTAIERNQKDALEAVKKQENKLFLELLREATKNIAPKSKPDIKYGHDWRNLLINDKNLESIENWDIPNVLIHASPSAPEGIAYMFCDPYSVGVYHLRQDYCLMPVSKTSQVCFVDMAMAILDSSRIEVYKV